MSTIIDLPDLAATEAFGRRLGALLFPGAVIGLDGPLGAGKTHLTRAVVEGLGGNGRAVSSPTFGLIHEYRARLPVFHFDAYRLRSPEEFRDLGVWEYYESGGVCLIEWAERVAAWLPTERLHIRIEPTGETTRRLTSIAVGEAYAEVVNSLLPEGDRTPDRLSTA